MVGGKRSKEMLKWIKKKLKKEKYPYFCPQPELAQRNHCQYLGVSCDRGWGNKCLMPYYGCLHQELEKDKYKYD